MIMYKKIELLHTEKHSLSTFFSEDLCHIKTLPYLSVVQSVIGSYDIKLGNGEMQSTGMGGFFIAPSDIVQTIIHRPERDTKRMDLRYVFLKIRLDDIYLFDRVFDFPVILPQKFNGRMNATFNRLFNTENIFDEYICYHEIIKILSSIATDRKVTPLPYYEKILSYIKAHYREKITVSALAEEAYISESHFYSIFRKDFGISPISYINNYRLSKAVELIVNTDKTFTEICTSVGIDDSIYFNKLFKKTYNMTPTEYRALYKIST